MNNAFIYVSSVSPFDHVIVIPPAPQHGTALAIVYGASHPGAKIVAFAGEQTAWISVACFLKGPYSLASFPLTAHIARLTSSGSGCIVGCEGWNSRMELAGFQDISKVLTCGVYALGFKGVVVYVGKSKSMYSRIYAHRNLWNQGRKGRLQPAWMPTSVKGMLFDEVYIRPCTLEQVDALEVEMINRYKPKYNIVSKTREAVAQPIELRINGVALVLNAHAKPPAFERRI